MGDRLLHAVAADPHLELTVDVERLTLAAPELSLEVAFPMDAATQERLVEGL